MSERLKLIYKDMIYNIVTTCHVQNKQERVNFRMKNKGRNIRNKI